MGVLDGRIAIITGASSGIGRATAARYAREGAAVALMARRTAELEEVATRLREDGRRVSVHPVDFVDGPATRRAVDAAATHFGRVDILVHVAGTNLKQRALTELAPDDWQMMLDANLSSAYHLTQAVLPHMRQQQGGLIVYVATYAVQRPDRSGVAYQASKHGLVGLAHGTMEEERGQGVRTSVIFPGLTDTPLLDKRPAPTPPEIVAQALQPEDVAEACLFVATLPPRVRVPELQIVPSRL